MVIEALLCKNQLEHSGFGVWVYFSLSLVWISIKRIAGSAANGIVLIWPLTFQRGRTGSSSKIAEAARSLHSLLKIVTC